LKKLPREHRISILLNESEFRTLDRFCAHYDVANRSRLIRETLMRAILKKMDKDQPTLFDD
jgi:metal-responsive CopG/Arc/MetJ family transcriptional regulator